VDQFWRRIWLHAPDMDDTARRELLVQTAQAAMFAKAPPTTTETWAGSTSERRRPAPAWLDLGLCPQ
jgi:hypothetical protein